jgi:hypothetical protein
MSRHVEEALPNGKGVLPMDALANDQKESEIARRPHRLDKRDEQEISWYAVVGFPGVGLNGTGRNYARSARREMPLITDPTSDWCLWLVLGDIPPIASAKLS